MKKEKSKQKDRLINLIKPHDLILVYRRNKLKEVVRVTK